MGDRGTIVVIQKHEETLRGIALYTHWGGSELEPIVEAALERGSSRIGDQDYLTRIIFSEMIQNEVLELTGYGIDAFWLGGPEHPVLVVEAWSGKVFSMPHGDLTTVEEVIGGYWFSGDPVSFSVNSF